MTNFCKIWILVAALLLPEGISENCDEKRPWPSYLNGLYCLFSSYHFQQNTNNARQGWGFGGTQEFTNDTYPKFLEIMKSHNLCLEQPSLNTHELDNLNKLIRPTIVEPSQQRCLADGTTHRVTGTFAKLSEVKPSCSETKRIEIFATDTVYFDTSFNSPACLNIVAPNWHTETPELTISVTAPNFLGINIRSPYEDYLKINSEQEKNVRNYSHGLNFYQRGSDSICPKNFVNTTQNYRNYLREFLDDKVLRQRVISFLKDIESNLAIRETYSFDDLLKDAKDLEGFYFKYHKIFNFLPFYDSLLADINRRVGESKGENKQVLQLLYVTLLTRKDAIEENKYRNLVVKMREFSGNVVEDMTRIQLLDKNSQGAVKEVEAAEKKAKRRKEENGLIQKEKNEYVATFSNKINASTHIIVELNKKIDETIAQIEKKQKGLVKEIEDLEKEAKKEKGEIAKLQEKLEENKKNKELAGGFKIAGAAFGIFSFLPVIGGVAGSVGSGLSGVGDALHSGLVHNVNIDGIDSNKFNVGKIDPSDKKYLQEYLNHAAQNCNKTENNKKENTDIASPSAGPKWSDFVHSISEIARAPKKGVDLYDEIQELGKHFLKNNTIKFSSKGEKKLRAAIEKLDKAGQILEAVDKFVGEIENLKGEVEVDNQKGERLDAEDAQIDNHIEDMHEMQNTICDSIGPMLGQIGHDMENWGDKQKNKSQSQLVFNEWQANEPIKATEEFIAKYYSRFQSATEIVQLFERFKGISKVIKDIFKAVEQYKNKIRIGLYMVDIMNSTLGEYEPIKDASLIRKKSELDLYFNTHLVLMEYTRYKNAVKQYSFPFADTYLRELTLQDDLDIASGSSTEVMIQRIQKADGDIAKDTVMVKDGIDKYIFKGIYFGDNNFDPFYVWNDSKAVHDLFSGKDVLLKADIRTTKLEVNAVKFTVVDLKFRAEKGIEKELYKELDTWEIYMTHLGDNYYHCNGKLYLISTTSQTIKFTFKLNDRNETEERNEVYAKLRTGDYVLSPYATWRIRLRSRFGQDFPEELKKFAQNVTLELVGTGQFIENKGDVCDRDLKKYYDEVDFSQVDLPAEDNFSKPQECVSASKPAIIIKDGSEGTVEEISFQHYFI